ncbi:MAG: dihydroorotate dehydrogenase [Thermoplasmata archaeon]|nr:MAG: dihydroorotate dehydrogenase [Thermoplasmata archaeon]
MVDISTKISKLKLKNPTMLASGILGETGDSLLRVGRGGAGAIVTKSIGVEPKEGHPNPTFVETEHGILNAMGLPNPGIEEYEKEVKLALGAGVPVIGSIFGSDSEEFEILAAKMEQYGISAVELNLSCPHTKGYGAELGHDSEKVEEITKAVKKAVDIPVFVKLSPNVSGIGEIAHAVEKSGGDGVVAINTLRAMVINTDLGVPVLANIKGGLSGPGIRPIGIRCVYEIKSATDLPIIGVGGILTGKDAVEYIMAGASAVQIGSGVFYKGAGIFNEVCQQIKKFMEAQGFETVKEMIGIAHK